MSACNVSEEEQSNIENSCDLETIRNENSISDECREAIQNALSPDLDNLTNNVISVGQGKIGNTPVLFVAGSDSTGSAIDLSTDSFVLKGDKNGTYETISTDNYQIKTISDYSGTIISMSSIVDYSGSMRDQDIDNAVEIFTDLFDLFDPVFESEIILFSSSVYEKLSFTSNTSELTSEMERDDNYTRGATALYDAIGTGLTNLSSQNGLAKVLVIATDGMENNSTVYSKSQIYSLSRQEKIPVIILGSLFSDTSFMEDLADETNGFYIYSKDFIQLKDAMSHLNDLLSNMQAIEIADTYWQDVSIFQLTINDKTLTFTLD